MANSTYPTMTGAVGVTEADTFIPEIWSDEVKATYEMNLVCAKLVRNIDHSGQKGDTIHVPAPGRGSAVSKAENVAVTIQNDVATSVDILIDNHYEYSKIIEDIVEIQAKDSYRRFYTEDAGYALATQVDSHILLRGKYLGDDNGSGSDWIHSNSYYADATNNLTAYAADVVTTSDVVTAVAIREMVKDLDDSDIPMNDRNWVVPPSVKLDLLGITEFTSSDFITGSPNQSGILGDIYGTTVYLTTNCPEVETAAANTAGDRLIASMMFHRDAIVLATQADVRSQTQYKQEYLGDLFTADTIYGVHEFQQEAGIILVVND